MAAKSNPCRRNTAAAQIAPTVSEPVMRRWPHPVLTAVPQEDSALHYITCTLSYQNQLLADIKSLLEQIALNSAGKDDSSGSTTVSYSKK